MNKEIELLKEVTGMMRTITSVQAIARSSGHPHLPTVFSQEVWNMVDNLNYLVNVQLEELALSHSYIWKDKKANCGT
jgi:hypothetical protein